MNIELKLSFSSFEELSLTVNKLNGLVTKSDAHKEETKNVTKASVDKKKESAPTPTEKALNAREAVALVDEKEAEEEANRVITFDEVKASIMNLCKVVNRDAGVAVLDKFGYKKVDAAMKESDYAPIVAACKAELIKAEKA